MRRKAAERAAINAPMQGTAADIIKRAMIFVDGWIQQQPEGRVSLIMQVHDELVFDVPIDEVAQLEGLIEAAIADAVKLAVPLVVDMSTGQNWLEAH